MCILKSCFSSPNDSDTAWLLCICPFEVTQQKDETYLLARYLNILSNLAGSNPGTQDLWLFLQFTPCPEPQLNWKYELIIQYFITSVDLTLWFPSIDCMEHLSTLFNRHLFDSVCRPEFV